LPGIGSYADGKICATGQDQFTGKDAEFMRDLYFNETVGSVQDGKFLLSWIYKFTELSIELDGNLGKNCLNNRCSFDVKSMMGVCGEGPKHAFDKGKSCIDGSEPISESEFQRRIKRAKELFGSRKSLNPTWEQLEDFNKEAKFLYSKRCANRMNCYYHFNRGSYMCHAHGLKPLLPLIILPFVLVLLRYLK
jgi:hypothetical protein